MGFKLAIFNGTFTIKNLKTGEHRTFRIRRQSEKSNFAPGRRIVWLLTGQNNTTDYTPFGFINDNSVSVSVFYKKRGVGEPSNWEKFATILQSLFHFRSASPYARYGLTMQEACTCIYCNRPLTDPLSIATGIGPECAKARNIDRSRLPKRPPMTAIDSLVVNPTGPEDEPHFDEDALLEKALDEKAWRQEHGIQ